MDAKCADIRTDLYAFTLLLLPQINQYMPLPFICHCSQQHQGNQYLATAIDQDGLRVNRRPTVPAVARPWGALALGLPTMAPTVRVTLLQLVDSGTTVTVLV